MIEGLKIFDWSRRFRKTPCRANRSNRKRGNIPPSTRARWQWKLIIVQQLVKIFPITDFVAEDIKARTITGRRRWNISFSPLEAGKKWFYEELKQFGNKDIICISPIRHGTAGLQRLCSGTILPIFGSGGPFIYGGAIPPTTEVVALQI